MKKLLCLLLTLTLLLSLICFASCNKDKLEKISKDCDTYTIALSYDEQNHVLSGTQKVTYTNKTDTTLNCVKFHLFANAYREDAKTSVVPIAYTSVAYPNGESYGSINFDYVKVDGVAVAYVIEGEDMDILNIPTEEIAPNKSVDIEMVYQISLANIHHRLGFSQNVVNLGNFYPVVCNTVEGSYVCTPYYNVGDPFVSAVANYDVSITVPQSYVVASTGSVTEANAVDDDITYNYNAKACRDFALVMSENYKKLSQTVDGVTINYYYFDDADAETSLATAVESWKYFCKNIGKYPYSQYSVCQTDFCYGGMEYPCLSMVTYKSTAYNEAIVHETAHQWFYGVVGNDQINHAWMDEGLVEFLTYLYMDESKLSTLAHNILANTKAYTTYVDVLNNYYSDANTTFRATNEYKNDGEYVMMTYIKGSLMFNTLYESMGKTKFFKALSNYYDQASFTLATPEQLSACFASVGGKQLANVFSAFAQGKEVIGKVTD